MIVTPLNNPIPFTERRFNVEMSGLELAFIKSLFGKCAGGSSSLFVVSRVMYKANPVNTRFGEAPINFPFIDLSDTNLEMYKERINDLNK